MQRSAVRAPVMSDVARLAGVSRVVLASKAVRGLSMQLAKAALDEGVAVLRSLGINGTVLVQ